ncbi:MAG: Fe-only nitrogenase accessory AnfO family protein [Negativicutes bacterium]|nr:Fe-only nitrogenase accessory AnfO family protein [Negativicutes bacterium]
MTREIAVFCGSDGTTASLGEPGTITVFRRKQGKWETVRTQELHLDSRGGLRELRRQMGEIFLFFGTCKVFVAKGVTGVPYYELEKAGFSIWEMTGAPRSFLTEVALQDAAAREERPAEPAIKVPQPTEVAPGHLAISIKEIQETECGVTSKEVLLPLLRKDHYSILEIICNHVPPWLEGEIQSKGLGFSKEKLGNNKFKVVVTKAAKEL